MASWARRRSCSMKRRRAKAETADGCSCGCRCHGRPARTARATAGRRSTLAPHWKKVAGTLVAGQDLENLRRALAGAVVEGEGHGAAVAGAAPDGGPEDGGGASADGPRQESGGSAEGGSGQGALGGVVHGNYIVRREGCAPVGECVIHRIQIAWDTDWSTAACPPTELP